MTMADMADLADRRPGAIRLENADAYLAPAPHVVQATRDAVGGDRYNSYLPLHGLPELRRAIADRYAADYGLSYDPDGEVIVTCGTGEAMLAVLLSYVNPGDRVLLTNPTHNGMARRIGWVVGPRELLKPVHDVHIFNGIMPSGFAQAGATAALAGPQDGVAASIATYQRNRDVLLQGLAAIPGLQVHASEGGYFFIAHIGPLRGTSKEFFARLLEEEDVATTPMVAWGSDD